MGRINSERLAFDGRNEIERNTWEDNNGGEEGIFGVVNFHVAHLLAEPEEGLSCVAHAGHVVRVSGVR